MDEKMLEELAASLGMSPEQMAQAIQSISAGSTFDEQSAAMQPQMDRAQGMADQPMGQGRMVSGFYVPPSPMSNLAGLAGKAAGAASLSGLQGEQKGLIEALRGGQQATGTLGAMDRMKESQLWQEILRRAKEQSQPLKDPYASAMPPWAPPQFGG